MKNNIPDYIPEKGFYFDGENNRHDYYFNRKPMTGITTVLSVIAKPSLIQWAANMAVDYISCEWSSNKSYTEDEIAVILTEAKTAHRKKKEEAGEKGTFCHSWLEQWILAEMKRTQNT